MPTIPLYDASAPPDGYHRVAAPGGYVFVYAGLITTTTSEDELAAVIAHELAHISQHHLERAFEDAKKKAPLYALATLGMLIAAGGSSQSAGPGILTAGMGVSFSPIDLDFYLQEHVLMPRTIESDDDSGNILSKGDASGHITTFGLTAGVKF